MERQLLQSAAMLLAALAAAWEAHAQDPKEGLRDQKGGLVSEKTRMKFSEAQMEDITNENFPDLIESFDYPNADIADVIKAISELTGKNFIVDPGVRGKITIIAPSQITVAEAYKAFLSALAINSMTVVPGDGFLKIKTARNAQRDSIETYSGAYYPTSDLMITRIVKLKYISADEVNKNLRILASTNGEIISYPPTNSLIISDFGSNIDRIMKILGQLDIPGFEEQLEVIRIRYAKAKDLADLLDQIITKGEGRQGGNTFGGVPRFRRASSPDGASTTSGAENYSLVLPDERTNSIIVVGNQAGIEKIRKLVGRLDFRLRPEEAGGVYVYYVRNSEAEKIADTLNGIAGESKKSAEQGVAPKATPTGAAPVGPSANVIFGGDVKVTADKITNSLIVTASKPDYEVVKSLLAKIDIPRDQVYVKTVIMELGATAKTQWGINYYQFAKGTNGIGRVGFRSGGSSLDSLLNPANDTGAILGFGSGGVIDLNIAGATVKVTSLAGMLNFFKANAQGNVLSEPTIMALDNEEAEIEVGEKVPVGVTQTTTGSSVSNSIERQPATIKLTLTPYISPDSDAVQLKLKQEINDVSSRQIQASELAKTSTALSTRSIKTQIVVNSGDTAVLGGLMQDKDSESVTKVPILGDIPILGWLFKSKTVDKEKRNLLVFITPKVVRNAEDGANILNQKLNERIEFIQRNLNGRDPYGEAIDNLPRRAVKEESTDQFNDEPASESF
ncbi:MAG: type II secretion system secretin GspD [Bdellovibrionales bacterium]